MSEDDWAFDHRTPSDWGAIARLAELDKDVPPPGKDSQFSARLAPEVTLPAQIPLPERALEDGQFNRFGK